MAYLLNADRQKCAPKNARRPPGPEPAHGKVNKRAGPSRAAILERPTKLSTQELGDPSESGQSNERAYSIPLHKDKCFGSFPKLCSRSLKVAAAYR